jgi:hypothetical protein
VVGLTGAPVGERARVQVASRPPSKRRVCGRNAEGPLHDEAAGRRRPVERLVDAGRVGGAGAWPDGRSVRRESSISAHRRDVVPRRRARGRGASQAGHAGPRPGYSKNDTPIDKIGYPMRTVRVMASVK